jgi:alpha-L-fucosidase
VAGGSFSDAKDKPFTADDIRYTTKGNDLFAISLDNPSKPILIRSLSTAAGTITSVEMMGSSEKLTWKQDKNGLQIKNSASYPAKHAVVYKITLK